MEKLDKIIEHYLTMHTNYALLISGEWGCGKTYYYKHTLQALIENTPTVENNSKKYKSVSISLFGLNSIEQIQSEIFLSLIPLLY